MMMMVFCHEWIRGAREGRTRRTETGAASERRALVSTGIGCGVTPSAAAPRRRAPGVHRRSEVSVSSRVIVTFPGRSSRGGGTKRERGRWREAPRTHRAQEPGVDDAGPREALEEHLDAEDEHDGVCHDGGSEPGAGIDEECRKLFEARREHGGGRGAPRRHRPRAAPERTWTRHVRESAQRDARALRLVTRRAESRRTRARTECPRRCGGDAYRRHAVRLRRRGHRAVL
jgi:hypothetical protein